MLTFLKRLFTRAPKLTPTERRALENEANYRNWLATTAFKILNKKPDLLRVYTDRQGNNFYMFKNPLDMTAERITATESALASTEYNNRKPDLLERMDLIIETVQEIRRTGEMTGLNVIINNAAEVKYRAERLGTEETVLDLACLFFLIDGENPEVLNPLTTEKKRLLAIADDDLRAFFLRTTWDVFKTSTGYGSQHFLKSLGDEKRRRAMEAAKARKKRMKRGSGS